MPQTPDRRPGALIEDEEIRLVPNATGPTVNGALNYDGLAFVFRDNAGNFDPRNATGLVSSTTVVDVLAASAPVAGQALVATGPSSATWQNILSAAEHAALRQLIHFIDEGPAETFASGAYKEIVGGLFPTSVTWYDSSGVGKKKIVEKLYTWTGSTPTTIQWNMYDAAEVVVATVTDSITYSGQIEVSRTRTIA